MCGDEVVAGAPPWVSCLFEEAEDGDSDGVSSPASLALKRLNDEEWAKWCGKQICFAFEAEPDAKA